jgi:hypothetical protein
MDSAIPHDAKLPADHSALGYDLLGNSSEAHWLQAVAASQLEQSNSLERHTTELPSCSFWNDDERINVEVHASPYALPSLLTVELLLACYIDKVHNSFPILNGKAFTYQVHRVFAAMQEGTTPCLSSRWQAILNLVFAVGAKYLQLMDTDCITGEQDHLVFQMRARSLGLTTSIATDHTDVLQVQGLGLLAFYWLSTSQIER